MRQVFARLLLGLHALCVRAVVETPSSAVHVMRSPEEAPASGNR